MDDIFDEYFTETDPESRKEILDKMTAEAEAAAPEAEDASNLQQESGAASDLQQESEAAADLQPKSEAAADLQPKSEAAALPLSDRERQQLDQIRALFDIRYEQDKKGKYIDHFIACMLKLRDIAYNPAGSMKEKLYTRQVQETVHTLCLDRRDEFSEGILYREMYNLITFYIDVCYEDHQYNSVFLGLGWMKTDNLIAKIQRDLKLIWEQIPKFLGDHNEYLVFKEAIQDALDRQLKPDPRRRRRR